MLNIAGVMRAIIYPWLQVVIGQSRRYHADDTCVAISAPLPVAAASGIALLAIIIIIIIITMRIVIIITVASLS